MYAENEFDLPEYRVNPEAVSADKLAKALYEDTKDLKEYVDLDADYDIGRYDSRTGDTYIANTFRNGSPISGEFRNLINAHERAHKDGMDDTGAMIYELIADGKLALEIWGRRYAFAKMGEDSKDARMWKEAEKAFAGTEIEPYIQRARAIGNRYIESGGYNAFRNYEKMQAQTGARIN